MIIIKSKEEFSDFISDATSVGWMSFHRKRNANMFHSGHEYIVNYSKNKYHKSVISFINQQEAISGLDGSSKWRNKAEVYLNSWDQMGCINWAEKMGIDALIIPTIGKSRETFQLTNEMNSIKNLVDQIWIERGYPVYNKETHPIHYRTMMLLKIHLMRSINAPSNKLTTISSWKAGIFSLILNDMVNVPQVEYKFDIIDPLFNSDGLMVSEKNNRLSNSQLDILKTIPSIINDNAQNKINQTVLLNNLKRVEVKKINNINYSSRLEIKEVSIIDNPNIVGKNNKFFNIYYKMGKEINLYAYYEKN